MDMVDQALDAGKSVAVASAQGYTLYKRYPATQFTTIEHLPYPIRPEPAPELIGWVDECSTFTPEMLEAARKYGAPRS